MLKKSIQDAIKKGIEKGIYKSVALVQINDKGERITLITHTKNPVERLEYILLQVNKLLPAGSYSVECKTSQHVSSYVEKFPFEIKAPVMIDIKGGSELDKDIIDKTGNQETMNEINFEDYIDLIKEKERLTAQNALLLTQLEIEQKKNAGVSLNDSGGGSIGEKAITALSDNLPTVLNIFNKWMDQRDKDLELRERALNDKTGNNNTMSQKKLNGNSISKEQLIQHLEDLYLNNPDEFDKSLDKIKDSDLDLYSYCLDSLGMEEGEDEEEEQQ